jgi:hypothetical protein
MVYWLLRVSVANYRTDLNARQPVIEGNRFLIALPRIVTWVRGIIATPP